MQLKKLEDELGVMLFDRSKQPVVPTMAGKKIIEQARIVLAEAGKMKLRADESKNDLSGELRIGIIPTIAPYLLPRFTGGFKRSHPNIHIKIEETVTERIVELLKKDLLDVGILVTPLHNDKINEMPLYYEEMMVYASTSHKLSQQTGIGIKDMESPGIWLLSDGHCFRHQVVNLCNIQEINAGELPFDYEGGTLETLIKIIDKEGGFTLIPELASLEIEGIRKAQVRSFNNITPLREVSLVFTRKFAKALLTEAIASSIQQSVPAGMLQKERGTIVEWK
jgi:LysR family hydrogen peroxide-inducible transcriptional activator